MGLSSTFVIRLWKFGTTDAGAARTGLEQFETFHRIENSFVILEKTDSPPASMAPHAIAGRIDCQVAGFFGLP